VTDPVTTLIQAGAIPASPFAPSSRYANLPIQRYQAAPSDPGVAYVVRRFLPRLREVSVAALHLARAGDRIDLLAAHYLGDPELFWRIADANGESDPLRLTATPGTHVAIPLPPGSAGD
jgi:hypothetical protein